MAQILEGASSKKKRKVNRNDAIEVEKNPSIAIESSEEESDNEELLGVDKLAGMFAPLRCDLPSIDHLLVTLARTIRFNNSYEQLIDSLKWSKSLYWCINVPLSKSSLWTLLSKDDSNLIYKLFCDRCHDPIGKGKKVQKSCTCGSCGPGKEESHVATFLQIRLVPQLKDLLSLPNVTTALIQSRSSRIKSNSDPIQDIYHGDKYRTMTEPGKFLSNLSNFSLTLWTDGVNQKRSSIYPVVLQINELPPQERKRYTLLAGIWVSGKQEPNLAALLQPIIEDLKQLYDTGVTWKIGDLEITSKFATTVFTSSSITRATVLRMEEPNMPNACTWCLNPGKTLEDRQVYTNQAADLRTDLSLRESMIIAYRTEKAYFGVLGCTQLILLPEFKLPDGVVVEVCHSVYRGVVQELILLFLADTGKPWFIGSEENIKVINTRLQKIKTTLSKPRSISDHSSWSTEDCRNWLFYYSLPCLESILPMKYLTHFANLAKAVFICNSTSISKSDMNLAKTLLLKFVADFEKLYTEANMSYNVHLLTHLPNSVQNWGPVWVYSPSFEAMNEKFNSCVNSPCHRAEQIATRFFLERFVERAIEECKVNYKTREEVKNLLNIKQLPPGMQEGCYFIGDEKPTSRFLGVDEIRVLMNAGLKIEKKTVVSVFKKARVNGVDYATKAKHCYEIVHCRQIGFLRIERILSFKLGFEEIAGFIGKRFEETGSAYGTHYMRYVTPSEKTVFVSYKNVLAPGFTISTGKGTVAVEVCHSSEQD